jgi:hypothetical protein
MTQTQIRHKIQTCPFVREASPRQETLQVSEQLKKKNNLVMNPKGARHQDQQTYRD